MLKDAEQTSDLSNTMWVHGVLQAAALMCQCFALRVCRATITMASEEQEDGSSMCRRMTRRKSNLADLIDAQSQPAGSLMRQTM